MTKFLVNIWAYQYHGRFEVEAEDNPKSLEQSIVDKLGQNDIKWEHLGEMNDPRVNRITYEEVIEDGTTSAGPLHKEERSGPTMGAGSS